MSWLVGQNPEGATKGCQVLSDLDMVEGWVFAHNTSPQ